MAAEQKKNMIIRADGNAQIGAGHLMRCLTIADALTCRDGVCFWCADEASAELARQRGYEARVLGTDYRDMPSELPQWRRLRTDGDLTILVDSYYICPEYLQALREIGRVYLIDDLMRQAWPADGLINYNAFARRALYERLYGEADGMMPELCIGPSYVPLRPQFAGGNYRVRDSVRELLLTTGGGDHENIAGQILEKIGDCGCVIHVISGPYNPHGDWLAAYSAAHPGVKIHRRVEDMAGLMSQCDLAITAGGTTVYELCAVGVPLICFSCAENQEALAHYVGERGIGLGAGAYHRDAARTLDRIRRLTEQALTDRPLRIDISRRARQLVDGKGARRLAGALERAGKSRKI